MLKINDNSKILINQTAFIGDVVLTLPLAAKIKEIQPKCQLHFLTTKVSSQLPELLYEIDRVIIFDKRGEDKGFAGFKKLSKILKSENYDIIISPHKSARTSLINYWAKAKFSISFNISAFSFLYNIKVKYDRNKHEIDRNLDLLEPLINADNKKPPLLKLNFKSGTILKIDKYLIENQLNKFIIIAPGSVWATKRWLPDNFAELAKLLIDRGYKILLSGSKDDSIICQQIATKVKSNMLVDVSGKFSINDTIYLISKAETIITNDSAPIHFAGLTHTKTIAIFGPTIPEFGFAPIGKDDVIIQNENLKCRPCAIHGSNKCPIGTHDCMKSISPEIVFKKLI
jgi:heptosyltransferase-2